MHLPRSATGVVAGVLALVGLGSAIGWLTGRTGGSGVILDVLLPLALAGVLFAADQKPRIRRRPVTIDIPAEAPPSAAAAATSASASPLPTSNDPGAIDHQRSLAEGMRATLELLHSRLHLTSAILLWPRADGFAIRSGVSSRSDLVTGPIPFNAGILAAVQEDRRSAVMAPVRTDRPMAPWYGETGGVGAIIVLQVPVPEGRPAVLAADRASGDPWTEEEREVLEIAVRRLAADFAVERGLRDLGRDLDRLRTVCQGLVELSGVLGVESVCEATARAVAAFLDYDFLAVSLREESHHVVVYVEGDEAPTAKGRRHGLEEGIVGQVLRTNHLLPAGGVCRGATPIFCNDERVDGLRSLLVLPLRSESGEAIAALVLGARRPNMLRRPQLEILAMIGAQEGVKIDLAQAHEKIRLLATTDGLTGLANHRTFQHAFDMMLERGRRSQCPLCLVFCDLDHFKQINDTYGHPFGDEVLRRVAGVFLKTIRRVDLAARYGGEEFALLLEGADEQGGRQMAERIRLGVERLSLSHRGQPVPVTVSMGLAFFPKDAEDKDTLVSHADQALYRAKTGGRNRIVAWSEVGEGGRA